MITLMEETEMIGPNTHGGDIMITLMEETHDNTHGGDR